MEMNVDTIVDRSRLKKNKILILIFIVKMKYPNFF
jgi:hypothetical protein